MTETTRMTTLVAAAFIASPALAIDNTYLPAEDIPFAFEVPGQPQQLGPLWGVRAEGPAGTLLKVPAGFEAPIHGHTADYRAVVIEGRWRHWVPETGEGKGLELLPGAYWTQKADQMHADACVSDTDCVILLINEDPSRSIEKLASAAAGIEGRTYLHAVDMRESAAVEAAFSQIETVDHLVLTAVADEYGRAKPLVDLDKEDLERSFDKMRGYFTLVKAAAHRLAPTGSIVMMCGAASLRPPASGFSLLAAEGAAVPAFARALARELAPVRVNAVMAGVVDTPIHQHRRDDVAHWAESSLPAGRFGTPGDIADAILFAMGNRYLTGSIVLVDGGSLIS